MQLAVCHVCVANGRLSYLGCNWPCVISLLQLAVGHIYVATSRLS